MNSTTTNPRLSTMPTAKARPSCAVLCSCSCLITPPSFRQEAYSLACDQVDSLHYPRIALCHLRTDSIIRRECTLQWPCKDQAMGRRDNVSTSRAVVPTGSHRFFAALPSADTHRRFHWGDVDLAITA